MWAILFVCLFVCFFTFLFVLFGANSFALSAFGLEHAGVLLGGVHAVLLLGRRRGDLLLADTGTRVSTSLFRRTKATNHLARPPRLMIHLLYNTHTHTHTCKQTNDFLKKVLDRYLHINKIK